MCRFAEPVGGQAEISTNIPDVPESAGYPLMQATCTHHAPKHFIPAPKHLYSNPPLYTTMMMTPKLQIPIHSHPAPQYQKSPNCPSLPIPTFPLSCSETLWIILLVITRWRRGVSTLRTRKSPWRGPPSPPLLPIIPQQPILPQRYASAPLQRRTWERRLCWPVVQATNLPAKATFLHPPMLARHMCCTAIIILLSQ
jgi:hypothetical protein